MLKRLMLGAVLFTLAACASAPLHLSSAGLAAFHGKRVVLVLDLVRDTAISAEAQTPKLLSEATTRKVVTWERSAVLTIGASPGGWAPLVTTGLTELLKDLTPSERAVLAPYVDMALAVIKEVTR